MVEFVENQCRELHEKIHRKEKVNWLYVAEAFSYTWNNDVWLKDVSEYYLFHAFIRVR